jgi:hypothetical protein
MRNSVLIAVAIAALVCGSVEARPGGGRARAGSNTRSGSVTRPNGRTGTFQGQNTWTRGQGNAQNSYQGTRTNAKGQSSTVNRQQNVTKTGDNTFHRDGSQTVTGPNGKSRTSTASGDGTVQKTDNGYTKTYEGTRTNANGKTVEVDKTVNVQKNADGTVTRDREVEYSKPTGEALGTSKTSTTHTPGQGSTTTGTYTNQNGKTWTGESTRTPVISPSPVTEPTTP